MKVEESGFAMLSINPRVSRQAYIVLSCSLYSLLLRISYMILIDKGGSVFPITYAIVTLKYVIMMRVTLP